MAARALLSSPRALLIALVVVLVALALARPIDHDESQYVAAAVLVAHGYVPYRDFAYLQTPLQPWLFAPVVWVAGTFAWPMLRILNALLGAGAIACVYRAARAGGAGERPSLLACALLSSCDILLFSIGTARNDALPLVLLSAALPLVVRAANGRGTRTGAALAGALLAAAAAAKISYALPALAYGLVALLDRRHRPLMIAAGALPIAAFLLAMMLADAQGFLFGVLQFPAQAPAQYYHAIGQAWKLDPATKVFDVLKFLALGAALPALWLTRRFRWRGRSAGAIDWLLIAGLVAALAPSPTWRQYLLPILPPLFLRLAIGWQVAWPGRPMRIALIVFACAGLAPSIEALIRAAPGMPMATALREGGAIRAALDHAAIAGPVATLSPQFLPATGRLPDPRFATGPFYFRSAGLLTVQEEFADTLVSRDTLGSHFGTPPQAILVGGEGQWTSGDAALDGMLERWAQASGYRQEPVASRRFRLWVRPR